MVRTRRCAARRSMLDALVNLGLVAQQQERLDEAAMHICGAPSTINPSLGAGAQQSGAHPDCCKAVARTRVQRISPRCDLHPIWRKHARDSLPYAIALGRFPEGIVHLRELLRDDVERPAALAALADALLEVGELNEAEADGKARIGTRPGRQRTLRHPGRYSRDKRRTRACDEGACNRGSSTPARFTLLGRFVFHLRRLCEWEKWRAPGRDSRPPLNDTPEPVSPFSLLCEPLTPAQQLACARRWTEQFNVVDPARRRPPVCSAPACASVIFPRTFTSTQSAYLIAEVLELHDRSRFEVFAYSYGPEDHSPMRARLRAACEHFVDVARDPDDVVAARIRDG